MKINLNNSPSFIRLVSIVIIQHKDPPKMTSSSYLWSDSEIFSLFSFVSRRDISESIRLYWIGMMHNDLKKITCLHIHFLECSLWMRPAFILCMFFFCKLIITDNTISLKGYKCLICSWILITFTIVFSVMRCKF